MCAVAEELAVALAAAPVLRHKDCVALTVKIRHIEAEFADTGAVRSVAGDKQSAVAHGRYYDAAPERFAVQGGQRQLLYREIRKRFQRGVPVPVEIALRGFVTRDELADKFRQRHLFIPYYLVEYEAADQKQQDNEYSEHGCKDYQSRFHFSHFPSVIRPAFTHHAQVKTKSRIIFIEIA